MDDVRKTNVQDDRAPRNSIVVASLQPDLIPMLRYLFSADGLEVVAAQEPQEMFEKLATTGARTLLLDLHLPTANPLRLLKTIRATCPQVAVITMAESACRELATESIGVGANGFVLEPLDFQILRRLLHGEIREDSACESPQPLIESRGQVSCK